MTLDIKIKEMKEYLIEKDINKIQNIKLKNIKEPDLDEEDESLLNEYKYYVKLLKRLKKYIKLNEDKHMIIDISLDRNDNIVGILTTINLNSNDVGIPIEIILLTGSSNKSYMDCICYDINNYALLYINNFRSKISNKGYGSILLRKLEDKAKEINVVLRKYGLKEITSVEGIAVADKNVIDENSLINLYKQYGFNVDCDNNMVKYL